MLGSLLALSLLPSPQQTQTVVLYRGAPLSGESQITRYWPVEDTYLDPQKPDQNFGGQGKLAGGDGKTVLIKFADIARVIGPNKRIKKASLSLTLYSGRIAKPRSVSQVQVPWGEGPVHVFSQFLAKPGEAVKAPDWSATYRHRRAGADAIGWQTPGGLGASDARPIAEATSRVDDQRIVIDGLESAVQAMADKWYENHGLAISFDAPVEFESSQAPTGRPTLVVEYEDAPPASGADLSVTYIERVPEQERYGSEGAYVEKDGVPVMLNPGSADTKKWPVDGETVTYIAHVKNVGSAPSGRFFARWFVGERGGARVDLPPIQPGQELTVRFEKPFKNLHTDHRLQPIGVQIEPQGPDASASNNALEVHEGGLALGVWVERGFYEKVANFEDWLQGQFRYWNGVYMAQSRFSFAPSGSLERVRVQRISIVPDGTLSGPSKLPAGKATLAYDAEIGFAASDSLPSSDAFVRMASAQIGLADLSGMAITRDRITVEGFPGRQSADPYPGIMGGGDTRNEANVPSRINIPYEAVFDPFLERVDAEPSGLYSATEVAALNSNLGKRRGYSGEYLYDTPSVTLIRAVDMAGRPLPYVEMSLYQSQNGRISGEPTLTLKSDAGGSVMLPNRPTGEAAPLTTLTGHILKPNPFGRIDARGGNGVFLIKGIYKGHTEWTWLKLWQLNDSYHRGNKGASILEVRFNMPLEPLDPENIAKGRAVASSAGGNLAGLTDESFDTVADLPDAKDAWVEVDLGRDRTIGELRLLAKEGDKFWQRFDVFVYATGEQPERAMLWTREVAWAWTSIARRNPESSGFSVAYRSLPQRIRYIRLVKRSDEKGPVRLADIKIAAVKTS